MALNRIRMYTFSPFDSTTEIQPADLFLDVLSGTSSFTLTQKTNTLLGATLQANLTYYNFFNGGYTKSGSYGFVTDSAVATGANLVAPGTNPISFAAYDQTIVDSNTCATQQNVQIYVGDNTDISSQIYVPRYPNTQLPLVFRDEIGYGATAAMMMLSCATSDIYGTPVQFASTIYLPAIQAQALTCGTTTLGSNTVITVGVPAAEEFEVPFLASQTFVVINKGNSTEETCVLTGVNTSSGTITVAATNYGHNPGETVYHNVYGIWGQVNMPVNFTSHTAQVYYNITLYASGSIQSRL